MSAAVWGGAAPHSGSGSGLWGSPALPAWPRVAAAPARGGTRSSPALRYAQCKELLPTGSSVSLVTAGRRYSGKEAGSARKGRQVWGETALRGARASPTPYTVSELPGPRSPGVRPVPRSPDRRNVGRPRPGLESAMKGCSALPGGIQPASRGEHSSDLRRCELPSLPRG